MKAVTILSALAAMVNGAAINLDQGSTPWKTQQPLDVKIEQVGNSELKAVVTNVGSAPIRVLKTGSILDSVPVEKTQIFSASDFSAAGTASNIAFQGIRLYVQDFDLPDEAFQTFAPGEVVEVQWDAAQVHDLSSGGDFNISSVGSLRYAWEGTNNIAGQVLYDSGMLTAHVDGAQAAASFSAFHEGIQQKRATLVNDCSSSQLSQVKDAMNKGSSYAAGAATAAKAGTRLTQYFRANNANVQNQVSDVLTKSANWLGSTSSGANLHCKDVGNFCNSGAAAYCQPGHNGYVVVCSGWFSFPASSSQCQGVDRGQVLVHEATHLSEIGATDDHCYGYKGCVDSLGTTQALNNADSFALYTNGIRNNC